MHDCFLDAMIGHYEVCTSYRAISFFFFGKEKKGMHDDVAHRLRIMIGLGHSLFFSWRAGHLCERSYSQVSLSLTDDFLGCCDGISQRGPVGGGQSSSADGQIPSLGSSTSNQPTTRLDENLELPTHPRIHCMLGSMYYTLLFETRTHWRPDRHSCRDSEG